MSNHIPYRNVLEKYIVRCEMRCIHDTIICTHIAKARVSTYQTSISMNNPYRSEGRCYLATIACNDHRIRTMKALSPEVSSLWQWYQFLTIIVMLIWTQITLHVVFRVRPSQPLTKYYHPADMTSILNGHWSHTWVKQNILHVILLGLTHRFLLTAIKIPTTMNISIRITTRPMIRPERRNHMKDILGSLKISNSEQQVQGLYLLSGRRYDHENVQSRGFKTSEDLAVRRPST